MFFYPILVPSWTIARVIIMMDLSVHPWIFDDALQLARRQRRGGGGGGRGLDKTLANVAVEAE